MRFLPTTSTLSSGTYSMARTESGAHLMYSAWIAYRPNVQSSRLLCLCARAIVHPGPEDLCVRGKKTTNLCM
jgi:hypothetical protein